MTLSKKLLVSRLSFSLGDCEKSERRKNYDNETNRIRFLFLFTAGSFDSVLHAGDWAYNFEQDTGCGATSCVGNSFMNLMQGYAAVVPVMPAAGNHVSHI